MENFSPRAHVFREVSSEKSKRQKISLFSMNNEPLLNKFNGSFLKEEFGTIYQRDGY